MKDRSPSITYYSLHYLTLPQYIYQDFTIFVYKPTAHRLLGDTVKSIGVNAPDEMIAPFFILI